MSKEYIQFKNKYIEFKKMFSFNSYGGGIKIKQDIDKLYETKNFVKLSGNTIDLFNKTKSANTYGELTQEGMINLINELIDKNIIKNINDLVYYDLGSGYGKTVINAVVNINFKRAVGIELAIERVKIAQNALNKLNDHFKKRIQLIHGNILEKDISDADVIFISNLCFSKEINDKLANKIANECKKGVIIMSSKQLTHNKLRNVLNTTTKMTWSQNSSIHINVKI